MQFSETLSSLVANLSRTGRGRKQTVSVSVDAFITVVSLWVAFSLRHGMPFSDFRSTWHLFVLLPIAAVIIFMSLGIYRWVIRSSNLTLFNQLVKASIATSLFLVFIAFILPSDRVTPRSLFVIFGMLLFLGTCGVRFLWQSIFKSADMGEPVAIYGAGSAGQQLFHSLSNGTEFRPLMFLDDNVAISGSTLAGIPVVDANSPELIHHMLGLEVERVILAMPRVAPAAYQERLENWQSKGIAVKTIPSIVDLVSGKAGIEQLRDISIADILGRAVVPPDRVLLGRCVTGKVVLVTGGGGSIGSELCRQICLQNPKKLFVLDHAEANLYQITEELNALVTEGKLARGAFESVLCSVTDEDGINTLFKENAIDTVYHAAAYKHVPIVEQQPEQGVRVNVFGTMNVLDTAIRHNAKHFLLVSTDKAVRPTNSMGATKRTAELVLQAKARQQDTTCISMVRFGNVLGSSGSVVPKFKKQIEMGGPITLTHPDITRFFMTIPEAAQLVLQAGAIAKGGDVFVLDMGKPIRIEDLATSMVRLAGKKLSRDSGNKADIDIVVEGLRPGEKMYEELFMSDDHKQTEVNKVFTANEFWLPWDKLRLDLDTLRKLDRDNDRFGMRAKLLEIAFYGVTDNTNVQESTTEEKSSVSIDKATQKESSIEIMA